MRWWLGEEAGVTHELTVPAAKMEKFQYLGNKNLRKRHEKYTQLSLPGGKKIGGVIIILYCQSTYHLI